MLLRVVQPVARPARADDPLQLVRLDPDDLLHPAVAGQPRLPPELQTLSAELHGPPGDPQEDEALALQLVDAHALHLFVFERAVGQLAEQGLRSCGCPRGGPA